MAKRTTITIIVTEKERLKLKRMALDRNTTVSALFRDRFFGKDTDLSMQARKE